MKVIIKYRLGLFIPICLIVTVCVKAQQHQYPEGGLEVINQTVKLQAFANLDLAALYSMNKSQLNTGGIQANFSSVYGDNGLIEVRVYDYNDELKQKGNFIFGCRTDRAGFHGDSWDAQAEYLHWGNDWITHEIPSTDIKFLSQHEHVGAMCSSPPADYWQTNNLYTKTALTFGSEMATTADIQSIPIVQGPAIIATSAGTIAIVSGVMHAINTMEGNEVQLQSFSEKLSAWKLKFEDENGDWCQVANPYTKVLIELTITNGLCENITIPGVGELKPAQFMPDAEFSTPVNVKDLETVSAQTNSYNLSENTEVLVAVPQGIDQFPIPTTVVVPKSPQYTGWLEVDVPENGRIFLIATEHAISSRNKSNAYKIYNAGSAVVLSVKDQGTPGEKVIPYNLYSVTAEAGSKLLLFVDEEGPFIAGYDFTVTQSVTSSLPEKLDALDNPDHYPNYVMVAAHRGYAPYYPQNSLDAIDANIDLDVDIVTVDARKTLDNKLVVASDLHLGRLTTLPDRLLPKQDANGNVLLSNLTLCEIRPDLCNDFTSEPVKLLNSNGMTGEFMPTLSEVLKRCQYRIIVQVDNAQEFLYEVFQEAEATGTTPHVVVNGSFETPTQLHDPNIVSNTHLIDWKRLRFTPVYTSSSGWDFATSISLFLGVANLNVPGIQLLYTTDADPLRAFKTLIEESNDRVIQREREPDNCEGVFDPVTYTFSDSDLRNDHSGDYEWLLNTNRKPGLLISDRPEAVLPILEIKGLRDMTKINP